jgi:hypothetical protein
MTKTTASASVSDVPKNEPSTANSDAFLEAVRTRRTIYTLEKSSPISDDKIEAIVKEAIKHVPSRLVPSYPLEAKAGRVADKG